jgi:UDP-glucose:(heptosyl)LPS alpha-1,3-glucosyltransferase
MRIPKREVRLGVIRQRYTAFGGAERFLERAIDALLERDVAVRIYTREWPATQGGRLEPVICNPFYMGRLWRDASFARAVRQALARDRPEIVQSHDRIEGCDVFRAGDGVHRAWLEERIRNGGSLERISIAANAYHRFVLDAEARLFESPKLKAVICISQMVAEDVRRYFSIDRGKLHVIYNAVDPDDFGPQVRANRPKTRALLGLDGSHFAFLLVGSGYHRKGVPTAIRALARLPDQVRLIVVGREKFMARYRMLASKAGVGARVIFAGPQRDPRPFYGAADAFVLPTLYDPLSNAVLEALACGLPVVTSTRCGAGELVESASAGWLCDSTDDAALAERMSRLLDPRECETMGSRARLAVSQLTPQAMTAQMLTLYENVLSLKQ